MKYVGVFTGVVVLAFVLAVSNINNTVFANSCCGIKEGIKEVSTGEQDKNICPVCGKAADSEGSPVEVESEGKTTTLCCEGCANAYKQNPEKYAEVEKPSESSKDKYLQPEKERKQRGEDYY